ncbi:MAG: hypothetical protein AAF458_10045 [Pseudomonadota bacterium]
MKPGAISSALFAAAGLTFAVLSAELLGVGLFGLGAVFVSVLIAVSPYVPVLLPFAKVVAALVGVLAILCAVLALLAATIGGSFRLPGAQALLVLLLGVVAVLGFVFARTPAPGNDPSTLEA